MKELSIKELRQKELEIMDFFDSLCAEYDLQYSIASGTLLGAVRHKGYIPWDDDIDVWMFRNEYEKLMSIMQLHDYPYKVLLPACEGNYLTFAKIIDPKTTVEQIEYGVSIPNLGVWIDVFPLDNIPDDRNKRKNYYRKNRFFHRVRNAGLLKHPKGLHTFPFWVISRIIKPVRSAQFMSKCCKSCDDVQTKYVGLTVFDPHSKKLVFERDRLQSFAYYEFEQHRYKGFEDYDYALSTQYGQYMKLPPIDQRRNPHAIRAWEMEELKH